MAKKYKGFNNPKWKEINGKSSHGNYRILSTGSKKKNRLLASMLARVMVSGQFGIDDKY